MRSPTLKEVRQLVEEELQTSQQLLQLVIDTIPQFIAWKDRNCVYLGCNQKLARVAGVSNPKDIVGKTDYDLAWTKAEADFFRQCDRQVIESNQPQWHIIEPQQQADGKQAWLDTTKLPLHDADGNTIGILAMFEDITERIEAQEALRSQEAELAALFGAMTDIVLVLDDNGRYIKIAPSNPSLLYKPSEELLGKTLHEVMPCADADFFLSYIHRTLVTQQTQRLEYSLPINNRLLWFDASISPLSEDRVIWVARDITARKQAEIERDRFFNISLDLLCIAGFDGYFKRINPAFEQLLGYTTEELLSQPFINFVHPEDLEATLAEVSRLSDGLNTIKFENRYRCKDGSYKWLSWRSASFVQDGLIYATARNVCDRKSAEAALAASEAKFRSLVENANDLIYSHTPDGILTYLSPKFSDLLGYDTTEFVGKSFVPLTHPDDLPAVADFLAQIVATNQKQAGLEIRVKHKDGSLCWVTINTSPMLDTEGNLVGFQGILRDISDRKLAEKEQARLLAILEATSDLVGTASPRGEILYLNQAGRSMVGIGENESLAGKVISQIHPDWAKNIILEQALPQAARCGTWIGETAVLGPDGEEIPLSQVAIAHKSHDGEVEYFSTIARDISDRKIAEEALRQSEQRLRTVIASAPIILFALDNQGQFTLSEGKGLEALGLKPGQVVGQSVYELYQDTAEIIPQIKQVLAGEEITNLVYYQAGLVFESRYRPLWDEDGEIIGLIGVSVDITERKQAEEALRRSEQQLKQKAQQLEQTIKELQRTQAQLIQSEKMSSLGQLVAGVAHEINNPVNFIYGNITHADEYIQDLLSLLNLYQKYYPNPVSQVQAAIASIDLDFLLEDLPKMLFSMKVGADRIKQIVTSLRTFSRLDEAETKAVNIHEGIDSTLMILQHRLKTQQNRAAIETIKDYGDLPLIECYPGQLNQVFLHILTNAIDALEELAYQRKTTHNPTIWIRTDLLDNQSISIHIADNGPGMSETVRKRLFDPFFTTKPVGKGTGMGLSISYQIIKERHGGELHCISSPGKGAEFIIQIPLNTDYIKFH